MNKIGGVLILMILCVVCFVAGTVVHDVFADPGETYLMEYNSTMTVVCHGEEKRAILWRYLSDDATMVHLQCRPYDFFATGYLPVVKSGD